MKNFLFGNFNIGIDNNQLNIVLTDKSKLFETNNENVDLIYRFQVSDFEFINNLILVEYNGGYELFNTINGYFIVFHWGTLKYAYGYYINDIINNDKVTVFYDTRMNDQIEMYYSEILGNLSIHIKFLRNSFALLHCSYINYQGEAILFLGSSGTGKSTQANLWEEYESIEIINGDRALIGQIDGKWYAFGYPACGSSAICKNITLPIKAFVILEQGKENRIENIPMSKKVTSLVAGIQVYPWMEGEMDLLFDLCIKIVQANTVLKLKCTISEEAVQVLKNKLEEK